jgi:predicted nucleic acid-binding protein
VFIYQLQANSRYVAMTDEIFSWLERVDSSAVTSTITMTELLVQPYRDADRELADLFQGLLSTYPNLTWVAPSLDIADLAAQFRAAHRLKTPDALQAATAVSAQATGLITNDSVFERIDAIETLVLDRLL